MRGNVSARIAFLLERPIVLTWIERFLQTDLLLLNDRLEPFMHHFDIHCIFLVTLNSSIDRQMFKNFHQLFVQIGVQNFD